jgi:hypothetical protein
MYATHSIEYPRLEDHFYVFGVRRGNIWVSWEEVKWYASLFDMKTVPELGIWKPSEYTEQDYKDAVLDIVVKQSTFGSKHFEGPKAGEDCSMEGIVTRNIDEFPPTWAGGINPENVFKWVRKGHVQTDEHWSKHWKRAFLKHEREAMKK